MTWVVPSDITDRWVGSGAPTDTDLIAALISDAEAVILSTYPGIQQRIDDDLLSVDFVVLVVSRMVTRVLRNPEGLSYVQQQTGPFGQSRNYGTGSTDIWLSPEEKAMLAPTTRGKAFQVDIAPNLIDPEYTRALSYEESLEERLWEEVGE